MKNPQFRLTAKAFRCGARYTWSTKEQCPEPARTDPGLPHPLPKNEGGEAIMADLKRTAATPPGGGF